MNQVQKYFLDYPTCMIGVKKAQISRIENGQDLTETTILKVFKALDVDTKLYYQEPRWR